MPWNRKTKHNPGYLGRTLIKGQNARRTHMPSADTDRHTEDLGDGSDYCTFNFKSVTQESCLEEFLTTAELAGRQFTAERENVQIVDPNEAKALLKEDERNEREDDHREFLCIPRRPLWDTETTPRELAEREKESFLGWRRKLAELQDEDKLVMTPFERNLEFWRQLWRVVEKSDVLVQILDARNPLLFFCQDLQKYVLEVSDQKMNLLLLNKADFLTKEQRLSWAQYFDERDIKAVFFSALDEQELAEKRIADEDEDEPSHGMDVNSNKNNPKLLSKDQLLDYFKKIHGTERQKVKPGMVTIGLVGYPNVGKSSTLNAILQDKKVSVSATPGKTKHFQTLFVDDELQLCDCPGLVFPNFVSSKAEMILNGILPIDQMIDHVSPVSLIASLIPRNVYETTYGIILPLPQDTEDPDRPLRSDELLNSYGFQRGFMTKRGLPDNHRSARYILKDVVNGKLLYCYAPPGVEQSEYHKHREGPKTRPNGMTQQQEKIMKSEIVSAKDFDQDYFRAKNIKVFSKGVHGVTGFTRQSADYVHHCAKEAEEGGDNLSLSNGSNSLVQKPWKKHNNRKKKEKLRRLYGDLDN